MARVTVEDCIEKVENRFDLIVLSAHRAREISAGDELTVPRDNDKNPVVSLRENGEKNDKKNSLKWFGTNRTHGVAFSLWRCDPRPS